MKTNHSSSIKQAHRRSVYDVARNSNRVGALRMTTTTATNETENAGETKRFARRRSSFELHVNRALNNLTDALTAETGRSRQLSDEEKNKLVTPHERVELEKALAFVRSVAGKFKPAAE